MMKPQHVTIVVSVKKFIRVHGLNIASFQYFVSEIDAENGDVVYIYILQNSKAWVMRQGLFFFNLRFYIEIFMNWNGKFVIIFNHETWFRICLCYAMSARI